MQPEIDFQPYLNSVVTTNQKWWQLYTLTDPEDKQRQEQESSPMFDFELMVQTVPKQEQKETVERFSVLRGLRKYALGEKPKPVLLVGRPGSGKSTALARLMLEQATNQISKGLETSEVSAHLPRIPVLVELCYWQGSISQLILDALHRHELVVSNEELETVLAQAILLFDGVNELPTDDARTQLIAFHHNHAKTPTIFTTRDVSLGGDLGIECKLEMQPLTKFQILAFIRTYIPEQAKAIQKQCKDRLWALGQTPLLLWKLCSLFQQTQTIPQNLGEVLRALTQSYGQQLQQDALVESDRRRWAELLKALAARMMQGEKPTELRVAIATTEIDRVFADYLQIPDPLASRKALDDLLKHHLLQRNGELVKFHHQWIQEYYAAEWLLAKLAGLDNSTLQQEYLNYLKWTEPVALMLSLLGEQAHAVRVVQQALAIDLRLGARLAEEVQLAFQASTANLIRQHPNASAFGKIATRKYDTYKYDTYKIGRKSAIFHFINAMNVANEESEVALFNVMEEFNWVEPLNDISIEAAILELLRVVKYSNWDVRCSAAEALGEIGIEVAISGLLRMMEHKYWSVRCHAAYALGKIGSEAAIPALLKAIEDSNEYVHSNAVYALGEIGSEAAISGLLKATKDSNWGERCLVVLALRRNGSEAVIPALLKAIEDSDQMVRYRAAEALGEIGSEEAIPVLLKATKDSDWGVCWMAANALAAIQENCKYYNYDLYQAYLAAQKGNSPSS